MLIKSTKQMELWCIGKYGMKVNDYIAYQGYGMSNQEKRFHLVPRIKEEYKQAQELLENANNLEFDNSNGEYR